MKESTTSPLVGAAFAAVLVLAIGVVGFDKSVGTALRPAVLAAALALAIWYVTNQL
jgi:uncharacterized membrane protein YeaQ/YmgE (transglycosylase-associated protein family)